LPNNFLNSGFRNSPPRQNDIGVRGYSLLETLLVVALIAILSALAIPQIIAERRLSRSIGITREISSNLRYARQLAMSQRQAFTFQYNDSTKQISIIDHNNNPGTALFGDPAYPNNFGSVVVNTTPLATGGLVASEIVYGLPAGVLNVPLADGASMTPLNNSQVNITFQPDGSVIDATGNPAARALFIYNSKEPRGTASAISVVGASGRVKIWRFNNGVSQYVE
jgi:prepilin-type N-terminal cleavage/methylation domain-containing protein